VHVGVEEAGDQVHPLGVDDLGRFAHGVAGVGAQVGDALAGHGQGVVLEHLAGGHAHEPRPGDHQVGRLPTGGHRGQPPAPFNPGGLVH